MARFNLKHAAAAAACTAGLVGGAIAMSGPAFASTAQQDYSCGSYGTITAEFDYTSPVLTVQADVSNILPGDVSPVSAVLGYSTPITVTGDVQAGQVSMSNGSVATDPGAPPSTVVITAPNLETGTGTVTVNCSAV